MPSIGLILLNVDELIEIEQRVAELHQVLGRSCNTWTGRRRAGFFARLGVSGEELGRLLGFGLVWRASQGKAEGCFNLAAVILARLGFDTGGKSFAASQYEIIIHEVKRL